MTEGLYDTTPPTGHAGFREVFTFWFGYAAAATSFAIWFKRRYL